MSSTIDPANLIAEAKAMLPQTVALRRRIHAQPELGLHNPKTAALVEEQMKGLDVEIARGPSTSGLIVSLAGKRKGKTILLRGDTDALPMPENTGLPFSSEIEGRMHACGHDAHTSMLVHAAHLLHRHRDDFAGTVKFMFQPGEEGFHGARRMIEDGLIEADPRPDACFAMHIIPNITAGILAGKPGPTMASADRWTVIVKGRGGHASAPHDAIDPMPVAFEIGLALQTMVTRRHSVFDPVVITIGRVAGGTTDNVIPETVELYGTLRATSPGARQGAQENIERVAKNVAAAHLCVAEVQFEQGYPVTINDAGFAAFARGVARDLLGEKGFVDMAAPVMGAEDFSYVLQKIPGCMFVLGVMPKERDPSGQIAPVHSNRMMLNEDAMATGIAMHAAVATRFLAA
ncbi:MAG TPA: M20 family metallopeptidase [Stellaceae bacterium]|nr:M20 family metallopeptidase [Stellaceae bacterium]